jgi:osmotically-inducible protein OsmY
MRIRARIVLFAVVAAPGFAAWPSSADTLIISPIGAASGENRPEPESFAAASDERIAAQVKQTFLAQRSPAAADAEIDVRDGVVTLSGKTVSEEYKRLAAVYARGVDGVKDVDNRMIVVGTEVSVKSAAVDKMDDAAVTARVKAALLLHCPKSALKTRVETMDGVVTLSGRARNTAEKESIGKLAADLDGVAAVDNRMTVKL